MELYKKLAFDNMVATAQDVIDKINEEGGGRHVATISDGHHTFDELYEFRKLYNAAFFNRLGGEIVYKSKRHQDGQLCFGGGWFIVVAELPTGQISNHYREKDWDLFNVTEYEVAPTAYDGHTPEDVKNRLEQYIKEYD